MKHVSHRQAWAGLALAALALPALAHEQFYDVVLTGSAESPANASPGSGTARILFDLDLVTISIDASFSNLLGTTTAVYVHCCTAVGGSGTSINATADAAPAGFALGATSGSFSIGYELALDATYSPAFRAAHGPMTVDALNALVFGAEDGKAYLSIRTTAFPGGEIRGFLVPEVVAVPEPATYSMMLAGLAAVAGLVRRRRARAQA